MNFRAVDYSFLHLRRILNEAKLCDELTHLTQSKMWPLVALFRD